VRIHLAREHALEFELFDLEGQSIDVALDFLQRACIGFFSREVDQFRGIAQGTLETIQAAYHLLELGTLLAQFLGSFRVIPDARLFELALYFLQTLVLIVVIKDTSSKSRSALRDL
jgi:hypothetical protein